MVLPDSADELPILSHIDGPDDVQHLTTSQAVDLADEIRRYLIASVSRTGGHMGPNLGVVELTIALHRIFNSPTDSMIFDTGHQVYVHKLLTGRKDFSHLREAGGLSGYPSRAESEHDIVENSHASTALSWADGISREKTRTGNSSWTVAVIGDGALTGGMAWEALNNIAEQPHRNIVIVVNDNGRSYAPTIGGMAHHLDALRTSEQYERALSWTKKTLLGMGEPGRAAFEALHGLKVGIKDVLAPQIMFEDLGLKYLGPIDGHDIVAMETALTRARSLHQAVIVHAITQKGRGYRPAEKDIADRFHAVGRIHPETGLPIKPARFGWTSVFADEIVKIAREREDVVGITAAMKLPVGLGPLSDEFPDRVVDVGISEQHAVTSAAGMAFMGAHPVVALYATFLNRAFDQVLMDVALHHAGVTFILDRAGITGADGPSHNGMWDIALLSIVPGLQIATPRDEETLRAALRRAIDIADAPTVVRYPKGPLPQPIPALRSVGPVDIVHEGGDGETKILIVALGAMVAQAIDASKQLASDATVCVAAPTWIQPVPDELVAMSRDYDLVVTVEDGVVRGGFGWALSQDTDVPVIPMGIPDEFLAHDSRAHIQHEIGLDAAGIVRSVRDYLKASNRH